MAQEQDSLPSYKDSTTMKHYRLEGYLSDLLSPRYSSYEKKWSAGNSLQQRLNLLWEPSRIFNVTAQLRTRFILNQPGRDSTYVNFQDGVVVQDGHIYFNTTLDRLNFKIIRKKLEITIGRQRINWGQSFVWNPNDLFNTYSFFDFDYPERPGSDAIRLQYYNTYTSGFELAVKADRNHNLTVAGLYRFNQLGQDFQLLGGVLNSEDMVIGAGWTGSLSSVSLFGEVSYFRNIRNSATTSGLTLLLIGCSTTFANSLTLLFEGLYSSKEITTDNLSGYLQGTLDVKKIALSRYNLFSQLSYPLAPLVHATLAIMWFPKSSAFSGFYTGPSLEFSLGDNLTLSAMTQYFNGKYPDPITTLLEKQTLMFGFVRLKWNF
jgi:hypothetical protein